MTDLAAVVAEIEAEADRRRQAGGAAIEAELDAAFARRAPAAAGVEFDDALERAKRASLMHVDVPTTSRKPGVAAIKRALRKALGWYLLFLAQQMTAFAGAITRALGLLSMRVSALEDALGRSTSRPLAEVEAMTPAGDATAAPRTPAVGATALGATALTAVEGRVLEVRTTADLADLRRHAEATLGGIVAEGVVDRLPLAGVLELVDLAAARLLPGGVLVVRSTSPGAWARRTDPVVADLSPGRPLHAETWAHLLHRHGFVEMAIDREAAVEDGLAAVPADVPGAEALNANAARLNALLFDGGPYTVTARRPG